MKKFLFRRIGIILVLYPIIVLGSDSSPFGIVAVWPYFPNVSTDNNTWGPIPKYSNNGVNEVMEIYKEKLALAQVCGLSWVRPNLLDGPHYISGSSPHWDFTYVDEGVSIIQQRNIVPFLAIGCPTGSYDGYGIWQPPQWKAYDIADTMVEHYDGDKFKDMTGLQKPIQYYEIGNEMYAFNNYTFQVNPDNGNPKYYRTYLDKDTYFNECTDDDGNVVRWEFKDAYKHGSETMDLLDLSLQDFANYIADVYNGANAAAANGGIHAKIVGPVLFSYTTNNPGFWDVYVEVSDHRILKPMPIRLYPAPDEFWSRFLSHASSYLDVISVHFYHWNVNTLLDDMDELKGYLSTYGAGDKPIWLTETGWLTPDPDSDPDATTSFTPSQRIGNVADLNGDGNYEDDKANNYVQFCRGMIERGWNTKGNKVFFFTLTDYYPWYGATGGGGAGWGILEAENAGSDGVSHFFPSNTLPRYGLRGAGPFTPKPAFDSLQHFIFFNSDQANFNGDNNQRKLVADNVGNLHLVNSSWGDIHYSMSADGGNSWQNFPVVGQGESPTVTVSNGTVIVTWVSDNTLYCREKTGTTWSNTYSLGLPYLGCGVFNYAIVADNNDNVHIGCKACYMPTAGSKYFNDVYHGCFSVNNPGGITWEPLWSAPQLTLNSQPVSISIDVDVNNVPYIVYETQSIISGISYLDCATKQNTGWQINYAFNEGASPYIDAGSGYVKDGYVRIVFVKNSSHQICITVKDPTGNWATNYLNGTNPSSPQVYGPTVIWADNGIIYGSGGIISGIQALSTGSDAYPQIASTHGGIGLFGLDKLCYAYTEEHKFPSYNSIWEIKVGGKFTNTYYLPDNTHISASNAIPDNAIVYCLGNTVIDPGVTLTVNPGVRFYYLNSGNQQGQLTVKGKLIAVGSDSDSIKFTSASPNPKGSDWYGIVFFGTGADSSILDHCIIEYGAFGISCDHSSPIIQHNLIWKNYAGMPHGPSPFVNDSGGGIWCDHSHATISYNKIINNSIVSQPMTMGAERKNKSNNRNYKRDWGNQSNPSSKNLVGQLPTHTAGGRNFLKIENSMQEIKQTERFGAVSYKMVKGTGNSYQLPVVSGQFQRKLSTNGKNRVFALQRKATNSEECTLFTVDNEKTSNTPFKDPFSFPFLDTSSFVWCDSVCRADSISQANSICLADSIYRLDSMYLRDSIPKFPDSLCLSDSSDSLDAGISGKNSSLTITNNYIVQNGFMGIYFDTLTNSRIENNNLEYSGNDAIFISGLSSGNRITNNTIKANPILLQVSSGDRIANNTLNRSGIQSGTVTNDTINNNTMKNGMGIMASSCTNNIFTGNEIDSTGGLSLTSGSNNIISNNTLNYNGTGILDFGSNSTITGNTISHTSSSSPFGWPPNCGILAGGNSIVANNNVSYTAYGIQLSGGGSTVTNNVSNYNGSSGIGNFLFIGGPNNNNVTGNTTNNNGQYGIFFIGSNNNITGNTVTYNQRGINISGSNNTLTSNTASSNQYGICLNGSSNTITGNTANDNDNWGIYLSNSNNNTITNNVADSNLCGVYIANSRNNTLRNNTMNSGEYGIQLSGGDSDNVITSNVAKYDTFGIMLRNSFNNTDSNLIDSNNVSFNNEGIYFYNNIPAGIPIIPSISGNVIISNTVNSNRDCGIFLNSSNRNRVTGNTVNSNGYGISITANSNNNTVKNNTINFNRYGLFSYNSSDSLVNNVASSNTVGLILDNDNPTFVMPPLNPPPLFFNILRNNSMTNNRYNFWINGQQSFHFWQDIDTTNKVNTRPIYYYTAGNNFTVPGNAGFVGLINCNNVKVNNLRLGNNSNGILLYNTNNSVIKNNRIDTSGTAGIALYSSSNDSITGNKVLYSIPPDTNGNSIGMLIDTSNKTIVQGNIIDSNYIDTVTTDGIILWSSDSNKVINNTCNNSIRYGIGIEGTGINSVTLTNNDVEKNNTGIYSNSDNLALVSGTYNTVANNDTGISIMQGKANFGKINPATAIGGNNHIYNNTVWDMCNYTPDTVLAEGNKWSSYTASAIQAKIYGPVDITGFYTWGPIAGSPTFKGKVFVGGEITVPKGQTLTINQGTTLYFASGANPPAQLIVQGTLDTKGTPNSPITFTSDAIVPKPGDWGGIIFKKAGGKCGGGSNTEVKSCIIKYADKGISFIDSACTFKVDKCVLTNCNTGVYSLIDNLNIEQNTINNNSKGIWVNAGNVAIKNDTITNNGSGIFTSGRAAPSVKLSNILKNTKYGVYITDNSCPDFGDGCANNDANNKIYGNVNYNIYNNTRNKIFAEKNYWGTLNTDTIALYIWDKHDNPSFGEVLFSPIWKYIPGAKGNEYVSGGACGCESEVFVLKLYQNEPNPFRGKTKIKYSVPVTTEVSLKVYDSCGRCVKTLAQGTRAPGNYNETLDAKDYPAGIYFAKFSAKGGSTSDGVAGDYKEIRKLILMR